MIIVPSCLTLLRSTVFFAANLAWAKTGNRIAAKIAMIAITTRSSMSVKALRVIVFTSANQCPGQCPGEKNSGIVTQDFEESLVKLDIHLIFRKTPLIQQKFSLS